MLQLSQITSGIHSNAELISLLGPEKRLQIAEGLTEFPRELFELAEYIEVLDMSGNQLSNLPDDFSRFKNLRILFLSNNHFDHVPPVIAKCKKLEMIGFKTNHIKTVAEHALPVDTRWLILTDNNIEKLPESMGELHRLQKLALAGNELTALPQSMANCTNLELARLSANKLTEFPEFLLSLPKLSWLALSGNEFNETFCAEKTAMQKVPMAHMQLNQVLGQGASGVIHHGQWLNQPENLKGTDAEIAVKLFKGDVTSDGFPKDELACCLSAGEHENLIKVVAQLNEPQLSKANQLGLVMELIPSDYYNLGLPPSLKTCTRDTFNIGTEFTLNRIVKITYQLADAMAHMHANNISHGDVYAHNIMINDDAHMLFGDFGAATNLEPLPEALQQGFEKIEVRAFGCVLDDLLNHLSVADEGNLDATALKLLKDLCMQEAVLLRPSFEQIKDDLSVLIESPLPQIEIS